ncbi:uncharacterized protein LOC124457523 [Xenia sp. Carnegie-2017]|uniref:uncharacterized protein LOC124457523 n=1 Tax=Xenia sp. Carnegie-2017 TaxID=2897299 RepID=UPI001F04AAB1|nr:uncharacterized protein LOC124457523 [Xenia sp. Carnegie-2017]
MALHFFTLMTTDCEHCLDIECQITEKCDRQKDHYYHPKHVISEDISNQVSFFRLAFRAVAGSYLKAVNVATFEYFVMQLFNEKCIMMITNLQCRWDYIKQRVDNLSWKDHLTLLVLESIIQAHEKNITAKEVLDKP